MNYKSNKHQEMIKNPVERAIWELKKNGLLKKYSFLTTDDLSFNDGNKEVMLEKLQILLCVAAEELQTIIQKIK